MSKPAENIVHYSKIYGLATQAFPVLMSVFSCKTRYMYVIALINCPVNCQLTIQIFVLFNIMFEFIARVFTVQSFLPCFNILRSESYSVLSTITLFEKTNFEVFGVLILYLYTLIIVLPFT